MLEKQRLFFALWPDADTRRALAGIVRRLPPGQGRIVAVDNLHITLSFIGEAGADTRECLEQAATDVALQPLTLTLDKLGYFARTRVLWLGASAVPPELEALVKDLNRRLRRCGYKPEKRRFVPHLTLARKARPLPEAIEFEPVNWRIGGFSLMQSVAADKGVRYRELKRYGNE